MIAAYIQHLTEEGPEGIFFGEKPSATHDPRLLRFEQRSRDEFFKDLADLFERLLLKQSHFFGKLLLL